MTQQDTLYYQSRAETEARQAERATDADAARVHRMMSKLYRERAADTRSFLLSEG